MNKIELALYLLMNFHKSYKIKILKKITSLEFTPQINFVVGS